MIFKEYDGYTNPRSVVLDRVAVWARILGLPDNYLNEPVIKGMCRKLGTIMEVQIQLPAGYVGAFMRVRANLDVNKKLEHFVSITRGGKKDWYMVKYEKMPIFCNHCGLLGHWYEECGTGEHDMSKFEWGDFILADEWKNRGGGRGTGRGAGRGRGGSSFGRGVGRGEQRSHDIVYPNGVQARSWRFNSMGQIGSDGAAAMDVEDPKAALQNQSSQDVRNELLNVHGKRTADDVVVAPTVGNMAIEPVSAEGDKFGQFMNPSEKSADLQNNTREETDLVADSTPQQNANKKLRGDDGNLVSQNNIDLAGSLEGRRQQDQ